MSTARHTKCVAAFEGLEHKSLLSAITVTTLDDVTNAADGVTSLREAVATANERPGDDTITFEASLYDDKPSVIRLTSGQLEISDTIGKTSIIGPGSERMQISGSSLDRIFSVQPYVEAGMSGLTLTDGVAAQGGAVFNSGQLEFSDVRLTNNIAEGAEGRGGTKGCDMTRTPDPGRPGLTAGNCLDAEGGAVFSNGDLRIVDSLFSKIRPTAAAEMPWAIPSLIRHRSLCMPRTLSIETLSPADHHGGASIEIDTFGCIR